METILIVLAASSLAFAVALAHPRVRGAMTGVSTIGAIVALVAIAVVDLTAAALHANLAIAVAIALLDLALIAAAVILLRRNFELRQETQAAQSETRRQTEAAERGVCQQREERDLALRDRCSDMF